MSLALVDTSVWIDHLRHGDAALVKLLEENLVVVHPMVIGELALGNLRARRELLEDLADLPSAPVATHEEVLLLIEHRRLHGTGLDLVDAHLLASALIAADVRLWTRDRRLAEAAATASVGWRPSRG